MSCALDVNILLYASDEASPFHASAVRFLEEVAGGSEPVYIPWSTVMSYLRIATHPSIFSNPLNPAKAIDNIEALLGLPQIRTIGEGDGFWRMYRKSTSELSVRGNLVPDAHLAAILANNGIKTLYTNDADFRKFRFLDVRNPFTR